MKNAMLITALLAPMSLCSQGCMVAPSTGAARQALDASGHADGSLVGHDAFTNAASNVGLSPFAFVDTLSSIAQTNVSGANQEMTSIIGASSLVGSNYVKVTAARFGARILTAHADAISNVSSSDVVKFFTGNGNGSLTNTTPPTGCTTTIGSTTFQGFVAEDMDPATEAFRLSASRTNQGAYSWCEGITTIWRDSGGLHAHKLDNTGALVNVSLTGLCLTGDSAYQCLGKVTTSGKITIAPILVKTANQDAPSVNMISDTDAHVTDTTWPFGQPVTLVKDTNQSDMDDVWNRMRDGGAGQAAALTDFEARGASAP